MRIALLLTLTATSIFGAETQPASTAINRFGIDLHRILAKDNPNLCSSPYSIEFALAMTYAGAKGETQRQMAKVLHLPESNPHEGFSALRDVMDAAAKGSLTLASANRLFGQEGFAFRKEYLELLKRSYSAPLETLDFKKNSAQATKTINRWVEKETRDRIRDLIPDGALNAQTVLVLANAVYLKADWLHPFEKAMTMPRPFHIDGKRGSTDVPTMQREGKFGYLKKEGFVAVSLPYADSELQFLILLPDEIDGLAKLEAGLSAQLLSECSRLEEKQLDLTLPKLKMEPAFALNKTLSEMGMKAAFDIPPGSADFDGIAPKKPNDYLYISDVFHKTFLQVDEKGTEAAAATAVVMRRLSVPAAPPEIIEVRVDRPYLFAIQEKSTGVCLFLGRVSDPR